MSKKKLVILIVIAVVVLLLIATGVFFCVNGGTVEKRDGLWQNSDVYLTNLRFENDRVYYTVVNDTFRDQALLAYPRVQKRVSGTWQSMDVLGGKDAPTYFCDAFSELEGFVELVQPEKMTCGDYRVVFGNPYAEEQEMQASPCVAGYFTVSALQGGVFGETYEKDGFVQNTLLSCMITEANARGVSYEIHNRTSYLIYTNHKLSVLQKYRDGVWEELPLTQEEGIYVDREYWGWPGYYKEIYTGSVHRYQALGPGVYRVIVKMELRKSQSNTETEVVYATAYFALAKEDCGVFEYKDGILQNTHIKVHIGNETKNAPVDRISFMLYNESVFDVEQQRYAENENYDYMLEIFEDGVWKQAPTFGEGIREEGGQYYWEEKQLVSSAADLMDKRYIELAPGEYRIRVKYTVTGVMEGFEIPEGQPEAVAYFTVTAPTE